MHSRNYIAGTSLPVQTLIHEYTDLGQLKIKKLGEGTTLRQTVDYTYNIRGWLTSINNPALVSSSGDYFGMELLYNKINQGVGNQASFSGNISAIIWQTVPPSGLASPGIEGQKAYTYSYDKLSRLEYAFYMENTLGFWNKTGTYNEAISRYDLNGNIQGLTR